MYARPIWTFPISNQACLLVFCTELTTSMIRYVAPVSNACSTHEVLHTCDFSLQCC